MPAPSRPLPRRLPALVLDKLLLPELPSGAVRRNRLEQMLSAAGRVALVTAPAGYGKTVAVRQWAAASEVPTAWLSLDLLDESPASFWAHVIRALRGTMAGIDDEPELLLAERGPHDPLFLGVLVAQIEDGGGRSALVLDDVSRVRARSVLDGLALLVDRAGHLLHLVLTGRSDPALPIARWRSAGWVAELREEHLRLDDAEAVEVAATFTDLGLGDAEVIDLNHHVEGWPVGLQLALVSLTNAPDPAVAARQVTGSDRLLADYLVAEVLDQLPPRQRDVALHLSVLDWFDPDLCRDLVGVEAIPILRELQRKRLFLTTIDERRGSMRFHALFRELLENELRWRDPQLRTTLHRRAAELWKERGDLNAAYRHGVRTGDPGAVWELVLRPVLELVDAGDRAGLIGMMHRLPPALEVHEPSLALDLAAAWFFAGSDAEATAWCDRAELLMAREPVADAQRLHATRCMVALMLGDLGTATAHIAAYARVVGGGPASDPLARRFATTAARVTLATGRLDEARAWVDQAKAIASPVSIVSVTVPALEAWLSLARGEVATATALADLACDRAAELGMRPHHGAFEALVVASRCHLATGDLATAERLARGARADAAMLGFPWNRSRSGVLLADVLRLVRGPAASLEALADLRLDLGPLAPGPLAFELDAAEATALIGCGRADDARPLVAGLRDGPPRRLLLARLAGTGGAPARAEVVEGLLADRGGWAVPERLEAEVVLAAASAASGRATLEGLGAALAEGARLGWVSPFLAPGGGVEPVVRQLPVERLHPALSGVREPAQRALPLVARPLPEPLTRRELTILPLLATHLSYAQIAERLFLSVNTVKTNLKSLYRKLGVGARADAVEVARVSGLL